MHSNATLLARSLATRITPNFHYLDDTDERLAPCLFVSTEVWKVSVLNIEISALAPLYCDATFLVSLKSIKQRVIDPTTQFLICTPLISPPSSTGQHYETTSDCQA